MIVSLASYLLWLGETVLALAAGYQVSLRIAGQRGVLERLLVVGCVSTSTILLVVYTLSLLGAFRYLPTALVGIAVHGGLFFWAARSLKTPFRAQLSADGAAIARVFQDFVNEADFIAAAPVMFCAVTLSLSALQIWFHPNWAYDCVWYHKPMTNFVVQSGSLDWISSPIVFLNSFPRHAEMLAAWNVLLTRSTRLDDLPQLPLALLGAAAAAALCRRAGASKSHAVALGCVWLVLPSVALQLQTTHADVAGAAFFLVGFYFLTHTEFDFLARSITCLSFGLYAGTKGTGLFHLVLLSPWIVFRIWRALRSIPAPRWTARMKEAGLLFIMVAYPGLIIYLRNVLRTANPYWPLKFRIPLLGIELAGTLTPQQMGSYPPPFFGFSLSGIQRMWQGWFSTQGEFYQDIREFPFGFVFPWLLLPALGVLVLLLPFSRGSVLRSRLSFIALAIIAVVGPAAWWGRFTLALPVAGLGAYATVYQLVKAKALRRGLSAVLAALLVGTMANMSVGYRVIPFVGFSKDVEDKNSRTLRTAVGWLWPHDLADFREREFAMGDQLVHDESADFIGEFWTADLRNQVHFLAQKGLSPDQYLAELRRLDARWLVTGVGSALEERIRADPVHFQIVSQLPHQNALLYRLARP